MKQFFIHHVRGQARLPDGQALVVLLVFMVVSLTITSAAVVIILMNARSASRFEQAQDAIAQAENGVENTLLRLLRDPTYSGEAYTIDSGNVIVAVSGITNKVIQSKGTSRDFVRDLEVHASATGGAVTVTSWKEIF